MTSDISAHWQAYLKVLDGGDLDSEGYFRRLQDLSKNLFSTVIDIAVVDFHDTGLFVKIGTMSAASVDMELVR
jgi:hypothetical protein